MMYELVLGKKSRATFDKEGWREFFEARDSQVAGAAA